MQKMFFSIFRDICRVLPVLSYCIEKCSGFFLYSFTNAKNLDFPIPIIGTAFRKPQTSVWGIKYLSEIFYECTH